MDTGVAVFTDHKGAAQGADMWVCHPRGIDVKKLSSVRRNAIRFLLIGILAGLVAPAGLFAQGLFGGDRISPMQMFTVLAGGGMLALGAAGWMIGKRDDALEARNRELRTLTERLTGLSATDALTGIPNRRAFDQRLTVERARAARYGTPLSLVMVDLDHFKNLNDRHGHPAGDAMLRAVAAVLDREKRAGDLVARYGGEEFAAILPHTDEDSAAAWAERVRRAVAAIVVPGPAAPITATASFGVAQDAFAAQKDGDLVAAADRSLYEAKHRGRDQVARAGRIVGTAMVA